MGRAVGRPRCDTFNVDATRRAIKAGASARTLYEDYAASASKPLARSSWEQIVRRSPALPALQKKRKASRYEDAADRWREATPVKPPVLTLISDNPSIKLKGDALIVADAGRTLVYERRAEKPLAVVFIGYGGYLSIPALRFCCDHGVAVLLIDWERTFLTAVIAPKERTGPLIRAQARSPPLPIARAIIAAKIDAHAALRAIDHETAADAKAELRQSRNVGHVLMIEARAAKTAWASRSIVIKWREPGRIPASWKLPYSLRRAPTRSGRESSNSPRRASDPANALLNLSLAIQVGRLAVALAARGLSPSIGFLHTSPRFPLAYDALEFLRPTVEAGVWAFIDERAFSPRDFLIADNGQVKTGRELSAAFIAATALPADAIDDAAFSIVRLVERFAPKGR